MAYICKLFLKEECDGCGYCTGTLEDDEDDNPFEDFDIDYDERI